MSTEPRKILVLYQGEDSNEFVKETLAYLPKQKLGDYQLEKLSSGSNSFDKNIFNELLTKIVECEFAIALVAFDKRFASEAGNLWLEIGFWCSLRSPKSLFVLAQEHAHVNMPSDIQGRVSPRFSNTAELRTILAEICAELNEKPLRSKTSTFTDLDKIRDTLLDNEDNIDDISELFNCLNHIELADRKCCHKETLYIFLSELLRISKSNWEHNFIQYCLLEIHRNISEMQKIGYSKIPKDHKNYYKKSFDHYFTSLHSISTQLSDFSEKCLKRRDNSYPSLKKLKEYFKYRLLISSKNHKSPYEIQHIGSASYISLKKELNDFFVWLKDFLEKPNEYKINFKEQDRNSGRIENMYKSGDFALKMTQVLVDIGSNNFIGVSA